MKKITELSFKRLVFLMVICLTVIAVAGWFDSNNLSQDFWKYVLYIFVTPAAAAFFVILFQMGEIMTRKKAEKQRIMTIVTKEMEEIKYMPPDEKFGRLNDMNNQVGGDE